MNDDDIKNEFEEEEDLPKKNPLLDGLEDDIEGIDGIETEDEEEEEDDDEEDE